MKSPRSYLDELKSSTGKLPYYAWPGGYPIIYYCKDGGELCSSCANGENGSDASTDSDDPLWRLVGHGVHYTDSPRFCDHCNAAIDPANSGDPTIETGPKGSVASTVSEAFGGDGQQFTTDDGHSLDEICRGRGATVETENNGQRLRYLFADGSAIVDCGSAWDIEGSTPFSWASLGPCAEESD